MRSGLARLRAALAVACVSVAACGSDPASGPRTPADAGPKESGPRDASGPATGDAAPGLRELSFHATANEAPPADAKLVVVWTLGSGTPDYAYAFGSGSSSGTDVIVTLSAAPPPEALEQGTLGVGLIALVDPLDAPPEGKLAPGQFDPTKVLAFAPDHAIVYRGMSASVVPKGWDASFPEGYACARCERSAIDGDRDTFTVAPCSSVEVLLYTKNATYCRWT